MDVDADLHQRDDEQSSSAAPPRQRASGEQTSQPDPAPEIVLDAEVLRGFSELAELLDAVVVHARTCDMQPLGDDARCWAERLRMWLDMSATSADRRGSADSPA